MKITGYTSKTLKMAFAVLLAVVACGIAFMACRGGRDPGDGRNYRDLISKPVKELVDSGRALMFAGKNDSAYYIVSCGNQSLFRQNVGRGKEIVRAGMQQCRAHLLLLFS